MSRRRFHAVASCIVIAGLVLRYVLAFRVFAGQGFAWDLSTFADWMETIRVNGHDAYSADPSINYPPVFAQLLEALNFLGGRFATSGGWELLKWLPILADVGIAMLLLYAGRRWYSEGSGLWAAALYLFIPITWYDSAVWGQMDSVAALPMLGALILLADTQPEWAAVAFMAGVLTKPQAALALFVLVPAAIGMVRFSQLAWWRLLTAAGSALVAFVAFVNTWSMQVYVDGGMGNTPVLGNIAGLAGQYFATADLFPYMSVNAYNPWALAGSPSLASQFENVDVVWVSDAYEVLGVSAHALGLFAFAVFVLLVAWLLIRRPEPLVIFASSSVLLVAFFVVSTRVHERYLAQAFAVLALVWAQRWWQRLGVLVLAIASTANLHAILVGGLRISTDLLGAETPLNPYPHQGMPPEMYGLSWPSMPILNVLDSGIVRLCIAVVTAGLAALVWHLLRSSHRSTKAHVRIRTTWEA